MKMEELKEDNDQKVIDEDEFISRIKMERLEK